MDAHIHVGAGKYSQLASFPGPSQLFSLAAKKRERAWYPKSRDKRRRDVFDKGLKNGGRESSTSKLSAAFSYSKVTQ